MPLASSRKKVGYYVAQSIHSLLREVVSAFEGTPPGHFHMQKTPSKMLRSSHFSTNMSIMVCGWYHPLRLKLKKLKHSKTIPGRSFLQNLRLVLGMVLLRDGDLS